jgi:hypothetical protein
VMTIISDELGFLSGTGVEWKNEKEKIRVN